MRVCTWILSYRSWGNFIAMSKRTDFCSLQRTGRFSWIKSCYLVGIVAMKHWSIRWGKYLLLHWSGQFSPQQKHCHSFKDEIPWVGMNRLGTWFELVPSWELAKYPQKALLKMIFLHTPGGIYVSSLQDCPPLEKTQRPKIWVHHPRSKFRPEVG